MCRTTTDMQSLKKKKKKHLVICNTNYNDIYNNNIPLKRFPRPILSSLVFSYCRLWLHYHHSSEGSFPQLSPEPWWLSVSLGQKGNLLRGKSQIIVGWKLGELWIQSKLARMQCMGGGRFNKVPKTVFDSGSCVIAVCVEIAPSCGVRW